MKISQILSFWAKNSFIKIQTKLILKECLAFEEDTDLRTHDVTVYAFVYTNICEKNTNICL